jgi:hypothetical protein
VPSQNYFQGKYHKSHNADSLKRLAATLAFSFCGSGRIAARKGRTNITMSESNHETALRSIEKVLALLRSVQALEGTDKDGVEHLLEMAVENLKK